MPPHRGTSECPELRAVPASFHREERGIRVAFPQHARRRQAVRIAEAMEHTRISEFGSRLRRSFRAAAAARGARTALVISRTCCSGRAVEQPRRGAAGRDAREIGASTTSELRDVRPHDQENALSMADRVGLCRRRACADRARRHLPSAKNSFAAAFVGRRI